MLKDAVRPGPGNGCMTTGFRAKITKNFFSKNFFQRATWRLTPLAPTNLGWGAGQKTLWRISSHRTFIRNRRRLAVCQVAEITPRRPRMRQLLCSSASDTTPTTITTVSSKPCISILGPQ